MTHYEQDEVEGGKPMWCYNYFNQSYWLSPKIKLVIMQEAFIGSVFWENTPQDLTMSETERRARE